MSTDDFEFREVASETEWRLAYDVMHSFRPTLKLESFLCSRERLISQGYRLLALFSGGEIKCLAGVLISPHVLRGSELRVNDLVTATEERSNGYGKRMLEEIESLALSENCFRILLYSRVDNTRAHDFYENKGLFVRYGVEFSKELIPANLI